MLLPFCGVGKSLKLHLYHHYCPGTASSLVFVRFRILFHFLTSNVRDEDWQGKKENFHVLAWLSENDDIIQISEYGSYLPRIQK